MVYGEVVISRGEYRRHAEVENTNVFPLPFTFYYEVLFLSVVLPRIYCGNEVVGNSCRTDIASLMSVL